ncbi:MAG: GNAT family N-acetyltransferase [Massilia sp.]
MENADATSGGVVEDVAGARAAPGRSEPAQVTIHENTIPRFVEQQLAVLYESVYCTLARLRIYEPLLNVSTYVARTGDTIKAVFLFTQERDEIKVLNQQITIGAGEIRRFAEAVFSRYSSAQLISFYAIDATLDRLPFPLQKYPALEENILFLPATTDEYWASMSANFRGILRRAERRMKKDFRSFHHRILSNTEVSEDIVREIIRMAGERMAVKQKKAYIGEQDLGNLMRLIRAHGYVGVASVDGKLCGGSVWYWVGRRNFLHIIAHDPRYDHYKLGNLTLLMGVLDWIERGGRECWLMGGGYAHKSKFQAVTTHLDSLVIYRSRLALLLHYRRACAVAAKSLTRRVRNGVRARARGEGLGGRFFMLCLAVGRSLKRLR